MHSQDRLYSFITAIVFLAYIAVRIVFSAQAVEKPRVLTDTTSYVRIAGDPVEGLEFWAGSRPAAFPLLLKISEQDYSRTAELQLALSITAWGVLAYLVSRFIQFRWLQLLAIGVILAFSLERHVAGWDFVMLTESVSVSAFALFIAASLWLVQRWQASKVAVFVVAALLLAFTRDTNAWALLALAALLLVAIALRWIEYKAWIPAAGLALVFLLSNASANLSERWAFPLGNLIGIRVLPDPAALAYFRSCGMPVSPALLQLSGKFANADDQVMFRSPELEAFGYWIREQGKLCYVRWLIANPISSIGATLHEAGGLVAFPYVDRFFSTKYYSVLPGALGGVLYPERFTLWIWGYSTLAALMVILKRLWRANRMWGVFLCMNLLVFPHLFLTWHGDAMATDRHALSVGLQLYLSFWILNILVLQFLWTGVCQTIWVRGIERLPAKRSVPNGSVH